MDNSILITITSFIVFMSTGVTSPVNSLYVESLGASYAMIGLLGTVTSLTTIVFSYLWGRASDRAGQRKAFLILGLVMVALSYALMAVVSSYAYLFPLRMLGAIAMSAYSTSSLALMGDLLERRTGTRGCRMGIFRGLGSLGFGLMAFLSGSIADWFSIRVPFVVAAALLSVAALCSLGIREARAPGNPSSTVGGGLTVLRVSLALMWRDVVQAVKRIGGATTWPAHDQARGPADVAGRPKGLPLAPLLISAFLWSLVTGAVYAVWANYMVRELGYSRAAMSRLWALASTSEFPLMIVAGWLSDRLGRLPVLALAFLAWTLVFLGYVLVPGMPWIILVQLTRGFAYSAFTATAMTYATEVRSRSQRGQTSGLYSSAGGVGAILGAAMGGLQTQWMGFRAMIATNAVLIFGGAVYLAVTALDRTITGKRHAR